MATFGDPCSLSGNADSRGWLIRNPELASLSDNELYAMLEPGSLIRCRNAGLPTRPELEAACLAANETIRQAVDAGAARIGDCVRAHELLWDNT